MREEFILNSKLLVKGNNGQTGSLYIAIKILPKTEVLYSLKQNLHMQHFPYDMHVMDEQLLPYLQGLPTEKHPTWSQIFYQQE